MARDHDRDRRSWRDIDRKKDSSSHIDKTDPYKKSKRGARTDNRSKSYKSALDSFFDGGELPERFQKLSKTKEALSKGPGSKRQKVLKELRDAVGRSEIVSAVKAILELDGELPQDADALLSVLQHPDEVYVRDAISILEGLVLERPFKRKDLLIQRLKRIENLAEEPETAKLSENLRKKLG